MGSFWVLTMAAMPTAFSRQVSPASAPEIRTGARVSTARISVMRISASCALVQLAHAGPDAGEHISDVCVRLPADVPDVARVFCGCHDLIRAFVQADRDIFIPVEIDLSCRKYVFVDISARRLQDNSAPLADQALWRSE